MITLLDIASITAGIYHGYCDARGIPFEKEGLECALAYGPAIVQGGVGAIIGAISNRAVREPLVGNTLSFGATGVAIGGVETLIGYGIGYFAGHI